MGSIPCDQGSYWSEALTRFRESTPGQTIPSRPTSSPGACMLLQVQQPEQEDPLVSPTQPASRPGSCMRPQEQQPGLTHLHPWPSCMAPGAVAWPGDTPGSAPRPALNPLLRCTSRRCGLGQAHPQPQANAAVIPQVQQHGQGEL